MEKGKSAFIIYATISIISLTTGCIIFPNDGIIGMAIIIFSILLFPVGIILFIYYRNKERQSKILEDNFLKKLQQINEEKEQKEKYIKRIKETHISIANDFLEEYKINISSNNSTILTDSINEYIFDIYQTRTTAESILYVQELTLFYGLNIYDELNKFVKEYNLSALKVFKTFNYSIILSIFKIAKYGFNKDEYLYLISNCEIYLTPPKIDGHYMHMKPAFYEELNKSKVRQTATLNKIKESLSTNKNYCNRKSKDTSSHLTFLIVEMIEITSDLIKVNFKKSIKFYTTFDILTFIYFLVRKKIGNEIKCDYCIELIDKKFIKNVCKVFNTKNTEFDFIKLFYDRFDSLESIQLKNPQNTDNDLFNFISDQVLKDENLHIDNLYDKKIFIDEIQATTNKIYVEKNIKNILDSKEFNKLINIILNVLLDYKKEKNK